MGPETILFFRENLCSSAWIAGAGGGGFLYTWLAKNQEFSEVEDFLKGTEMTAHRASICFEPLLLEITQGPIL